VFAEVFSGRKRWFVAAPDAKPLFDGRNTTLQWYRRVAPSWPGRARLLEGTCGRGDLLYLPGFWWHSTLNVGQTVFMSVFV
jgi:ribosomal protein L16 Arg81 hydroxylase